MKTKASSSRKRALFLELEKWTKELERQQRAWLTTRALEEEKENKGELEGKHD